MLSRTAGVDPPPASASDLLGLFTSPLPSAERIAKWPPFVEKRPAGKVTLDCFTLGAGAGNPPKSAFGTFPTFCVQPGTPGLVALYRWQDETVVVNRQGNFQNRIVPTNLEILDSGVSQVRAHLEALESFVPRSDEFSPSVDQAPVNEAFPGAPYDLPPKLLKKIMPDYPQSARDAHIVGTVVLDAIIAEDGHVESLAILHSPAAGLSRAAITAVKQWQYAPETLNGHPVKVHTDLTVNFNMGSY